MKLGKKICEGKTKIIYEDKENTATEYMFFKNAITAGDGVKKDEIAGKGLIDWQTHVNVMEYLKKNEIAMTYISAPVEGYCLIRKIDKILPLEIVTRRVATGSVLALGFEEGHRFDPLYSQIFNKNDFLHDPLLDEKFLKFINKKYNYPVFEQGINLSERIFLLLEKGFAKSNHQYMDHKIEIGLILNGESYNPERSELVLIDEITAGSMRVWPYAHENPNLNQPNILSELNKEGMKDKQLYRDGKSLGQVKEGFEQIMEMTKYF